MTREELKSLTASLHKSAEEAVPVLGDGDKKEWIALRMDEILETNEPVLNCLLDLNTSAEVIEFMEEQYKERKEDTTGNDLPCATPPKTERHREVQSPYEVKTNKDRVIAGMENVQDPTIMVEEEIIIIEDISPEMSCTIKDRS